MYEVCGIGFAWIYARIGFVEVRWQLQSISTPSLPRRSWRPSSPRLQTGQEARRMTALEPEAAHTTPLPPIPTTTMLWELALGHHPAAPPASSDQPPLLQSPRILPGEVSPPPPPQPLPVVAARPH